MTIKQTPFGYFIDVTDVPERHFTDALLDDTARRLLCEALRDANDLADEGMKIDLGSVEVFTTLPDHLYDPEEHGPVRPYGLGFYFEAYDPEDEACALCAA